jgi:hypothetical protein
MKVPRFFITYAIKELFNPGTSEFKLGVLTIIGNALLMYIPGLNTATAFTLINALLAPMLQRFLKKMQDGEPVAVPAGPPTVTGVILVLALAGGGFSTAVAAEHRAVEVGTGTVDGADSDGNGESYAAAWYAPIGGRLASRVRVQSVSNLGDHGGPGVDAYGADLDLLGNFGLGARGALYIGGGLGGVWTDTVKQEAVAVTPGIAALHGTTPPAPVPPAPVVPLSVTVEDEDAFVRWSLVGGARLYFSPERRSGMGVEYRLSDGLSQATEKTGEVGAFLIIPAGK